ncbi:hypothetical protein BDV28DRAFT_2324 [Aspergillus coremiiformis]|uniref:CFEM domain-containing protein n=1 Tax=Aspergillus coremiiformis TaxID=138285 RepID=A0A5N6ZGP9_9EURO|nr:hypothetical protein BDV28DRAFT_2324 [Aspergillus coremiiformis]
MLLRPALVLVSASLAAGAAAAFSESSHTFPQCATTCQVQAFVDNSTLCAPTNIPCLCNDTGYADAVTMCVMATCTGREMIFTQRLSKHQCGVPPHKGRPEIEAATLIPLILGTILFVNRIVAKFMGIGGGWGADDYTIIAAYILAVVIFCLNIAVIHYGFGQNLWDITPMDNITIMLKYFYAFDLIYKIQVSLAKISVCLFLLRIFQSKVFRYTTFTIIGLNVAIAVTWVFTDCFRCTPAHLSWDEWEFPRDGTCMDFITIIFANAFVNIAVDTIMVLMPVYEVSKLNLSARRKLGVGVMFGLGIVLTAIAIIRVIVLYYNRGSNNRTVQLQPITHWSVLEVQITIICACLPTLRAMLVHIFPKLLGNTTNHSYYEDRNTPSGRRTFGRERMNSISHINKTISYSVDYMGPQPDSSSCVQLVEMDPHDQSERGSHGPSRN